MKTSLSAIALGALLACNFASAQVTITQQGTGNEAFTEQQGVVAPNFIPRATTIQIGNNNRAGDPATRTPGILQREPFGTANARIVQNGDENTANILQDGAVLPVNAIIEQVGTGNTAAISQTIQTFSDGVLSQTGTNNRATLEQSNITDSGFRAVQNGSDNQLTARQEQSVFGGIGVPVVTQTGSGNSVTLLLQRLLGTGAHIEQVGNQNTVTSTVRDGEAIINTILQDGTGNTAVSHLVGGFAFGSSLVIHRSIIDQKGNNNFASVMQTGPNDSLIAQVGSDNSATVAQTYIGPGDPNIAFIRQVGNGFAATITQTGASNNAGVYQH
jgi:hypothetical protein